MKPTIIAIVLILSMGALSAADDLYLNGLNETTYIYRTAKDSLNSYFKDAFSFSLGYKDFSLGIKFLAELPRYTTDQTQLIDELNSNKLNVKWTERYLEYEKDNLVLHGGTISESFGSGMIFRAWEDLEFETDTRIEGFLAKYNNFIKFKAIYGAVPNSTQKTKYDLTYGADAEVPVWEGIYMGASVLTVRTLNALDVYNQQDVYGGRINWSYSYWDGDVEYAKTALFNNSGANYEGTGINAYTNVYLNPGLIKSLTLGAGYKYYDRFHYKMHDLKTVNFHNETLADNQATGVDEEGLSGSVSMSPNDNFSYAVYYAEAWNSDYQKRMNDLFTNLEWHLDNRTLLAEYGSTEKLDKTTDHWQKDLKPSLSISMPISNYAFTAKAEYQYLEKTNHDITIWHYEPMLQLDFGMGRLSLSVAAESQWKTSADIMQAMYWLNSEIKYAAFEHTDLTIFVGKQAGGKVCRNGMCRYVAPFQGVKLEATTRF